MNSIHAALICQLLWKGRTAWSTGWGFKPLLQYTWPISYKALLLTYFYQYHSQGPAKGENATSFKFWIRGHAREKASCYLFLSSAPCRDFVLAKRLPLVYSTLFWLYKLELIFDFLLLRFLPGVRLRFPLRREGGASLRWYNFFFNSLTMLLML